MRLLKAAVYVLCSAAGWVDVHRRVERDEDVRIDLWKAYHCQQHLRGKPLVVVKQVRHQLSSEPEAQQGGGSLQLLRLPAATCSSLAASSLSPRFVTRWMPAARKASVSGGSNGISFAPAATVTTAERAKYVTTPPARQPLAPGAALAHAE